MIDLKLDVDEICSWFNPEQTSPFAIVRVSQEHAVSWPKILDVALRRCYISDDTLKKNSERTGRPGSELVSAALPDQGSTMAGDFGEFLVYLYHAAQKYPRNVIGPKKWQLKQDRTKPAPYSDVIGFVLPHWPNASDSDVLLCSEVKTKSTDGNSEPIATAIADCKKDQISRLAKTLVWLKERALTQELGSTKIEHLERFISATDFPAAKREFSAVAVICSSLAGGEIATAPDESATDHTLVVICVPNLKALYQNVYLAAQSCVMQSGTGE
jgi:hypothetical protein